MSALWFYVRSEAFETRLRPFIAGPLQEVLGPDAQIGRVLDALERSGEADNTFVMYSTDNGPHMNTWPDGAMTYDSTLGMAYVTYEPDVDDAYITISAERQRVPFTDVALVVGLGLAFVLVGSLIVLTHRVAGPLYRLSLVFGAWRDGRFLPPRGYSDHADHFANWFDAIRTRKPVVEDAVFGLRAAGPALRTPTEASWPRQRSTPSPTPPTNTGCCATSSRARSARPARPAPPSRG
mgnify:CR=1 FL=1